MDKKSLDQVLSMQRQANKYASRARVSKSVSGAQRDHDRRARLAIPATDYDQRVARPGLSRRKANDN